MNAWEFINKKIADGINVVLLYVLESEGSSPGRQGFKMVVAADGELNGTIGGGIMEQKLAERAKRMLVDDEAKVLLKRQYHDKQHSKDQSGMICSGSQLNVFIPLAVNDKTVIEKIIAATQQQVQLSPNGISLVENNQEGLRYNTDDDWAYTESINHQTVIHIVGGGHVGLALSELMRFLGFYIKLYDDRPQLNTLAANVFAHEKHIVNYESIGIGFSATANDYVVIMTIGYRTDKIVLKQFLNKPFFYLGLLGSQQKIETLFAEMKAEGTSEESLRCVSSPIGLDIGSKTTKEIAVSIAAEIIRKKNLHQ